jgi:hypothetical protein
MEAADQTCKGPVRAAKEICACNYSALGGSSRINKNHCDYHDTWLVICMLPVSRKLASHNGLQLLEGTAKMMVPRITALVAVTLDLIKDWKPIALPPPKTCFGTGPGSGSGSALVGFGSGTAPPTSAPDAPTSHQPAPHFYSSTPSANTG